MDAGAGIPQAERERVFVPFYRLPGETKGSGLGLSIARQIVRLHGGDVIATSRPDSASTIRVAIPAG
jgi:signal transduction histidine kinase